MIIAELLKKHEGLRLKPYKDTVGKLTIGYGRNLDDKGITLEEAEYLLANDIAAVTLACRETFSWFSFLSQNRQAVIIDMVFNMGISRFLGFKKMIQAIRDKDFDTAASEMLGSVWSKQVGHRAEE